MPSLKVTESQFHAWHAHREIQEPVPVTEYQVAYRGTPGDFLYRSKGGESQGLDTVRARTHEEALEDRASRSQHMNTCQYVVIGRSNGTERLVHKDLAEPTVKIFEVYRDAWRSDRDGTFTASTGRYTHTYSYKAV